MDWIAQLLCIFTSSQEPDLMRISRRSVLFLCLGLGVLLITGTAIAQVSPNFDLRWGSFHAGGQRQSTNFLIQDSTGQMAASVSTSSSAQIESGFVGSIAAPMATPTPTPTSTPVSTGADAFENDDTCANAKLIGADGTPQNRNFHYEGDVEWIRFTAPAKGTYVIRVENIGPKADAVIFLHNNCDAAPATADNNAFGSTVTIEWDIAQAGAYYLQLRQFDPSAFGADANYRVSVRLNTQPPSAPTNPRCISVNATTLAVQWKRSPERSVTRYRVNFKSLTGSNSGSEDVFGADTTYYQLGGLTPTHTYQLRVLAVNFSDIEGPTSGQVECTVRVPEDTTIPTIIVQQPSASTVFSTTASQVTVSGLTTDAGNNLSRANVKNMTNGAEGWDYTLEGSSDTFRVSDLPLSKGDNTVRLQIFDTAGNRGEQTITIRRLGDSPGAVIIVAGHNETFGLQTNIYNSTKRAYRVFRSAGFNPEDIYYIAPVPQDATNNGTPDTRAVTFNPAAVQQAITVWARDKVGPNKPLFIYLMDHGLENKFCVNGCNPGNHVTPDELDAWLRTLETELDGNGVPLLEVTIVYEACVSGSFVKREGATGSISRPNRVVITSAGYDNNAYASAQGAYFSDTFFSCIADSGDLKSCFDEGRNAVIAIGVKQTPFLDDNGDGVYNASDGTIAKDRYVTRFFSSIRPVITATDVQRQGTSGMLTALVTEGAEKVDLVWAAVFPPSFKEPTDVTLNLNVPVVRLEPVAAEKGRYRVNYPNGFIEDGDYRIIFYAQDRVGLNATPTRQGDAPTAPTLDQIFLPFLAR
jgi:hypothetical protein